MALHCMARLMRHTRHVEEEFPTVIRLSSVLAATDPLPRERRHALVMSVMALMFMSHEVISGESC